MDKTIDLQTDEQKAIAKYELTPESVAKMAKEYMELEVVPADTESYKVARAALTTCVSTRTGTDKRRKELNKEANNWIKIVNKAAKKLLAQLPPVEDHLRKELIREDNRKEAIKEEKERVEHERIDFIKHCMAHILSYASDIAFKSAEELRISLVSLDDMEFISFDYQEFSEQASNVYEKTYSQIKTMLAKRVKLDEEDAARKVESKRLEKTRLEQEKKEAELKKLKDKQDARERKAQEKIDADRKKIADEKAALEAEKKEEQERKDREAFEKKAAEDAKIKAETEAKENAEREEKKRIATVNKARLEILREMEIEHTAGDLGTMPDSEWMPMYEGYRQAWDRKQHKLFIDKLEKDRIESEKKAEEEKKRKEAAQPDKEKLIAYVFSLSEIKKPDLDTYGAELIFNEADHRLKELCAKIIKYIDTL